MKKYIYILAVSSVFFSGTIVSASNQQAKGIKAGKVLIKPSVGVFEKYNDNIYTQKKKKTRDFITFVTPSLTLEATDTPHTLRFTTGLGQNWYSKHSRDSFTDFNVGGNGRYMFDGSTFWDASGSYRRLHSSRGDNQADRSSNLKKPTPYDLFNAGTAVNKRFSGDFNKLVFRPHYDWTGYRYKNGTRINNTPLIQTMRSRDEHVFGGNIGYDLPSHMQIFTNLDGNLRVYKRNVPTKRDSKGGNYLVGLQYRPDSDLLASLAGGYMHQKWKKKEYSKVSAWNAAGRLDWNFDKSGKVRAALRRSIDEITDDGASASVRTDTTLTISHALYEDLSGSIGGRYSRFDYKGGKGSTNKNSDRRDNLYEGMLGLAYRINDVVLFTTDYTITANRSNLNTSNYNRNVVMAGLKVGYFE